MNFRLLSLTGCAVLCTACASLETGPYKFSEGWRKGEVVELAPAKQLTKHASRDCREMQVEPQGDYATVAYRNNRMTRYRIVPKPAEIKMSLGAEVMVNLQRCDNALVARPAAI